MTQPVRADETVTPKPDEVIRMARAQLGERWYGIYVLGKKVGWQRDAWTQPDKTTICNDIEYTLKLAFLGRVNTISATEKACYQFHPPFYLLRYESVRNDDGRLIRVTGEPEPSRKKGEESAWGKLAYRIETDSQARTNRVPMDSDLLTHTVAWAPIARMEPGDMVKSFSFDELTAQKRWQNITLQSKEEKNLMGRKQPIYKVLIEDELGMKLDALITLDGIILEGSMGPSIRIVLEDKKTAIRTDLALLDLYSTSFINATGKLDYARVTDVTRCKLKLSGSAPLNLAANRRQQVVERGDTFVVLDITATPEPATAGTPDEKFTSCNADIPCDLDDFRKLAGDITKGVDGALARARALSQWVNRNFQYSLASSGGTGDLILKERKGDCTEYSKALITLLRAAGLPARQLSGVVLASDTPLSFGYHAWVEVYIDGTGWVSLDPTWGTWPVDATHIVFDVDEGLQMASHLGGLEIEILEVEYKEKDKDKENQPQRRRER